MEFNQINLTTRDHVDRRIIYGLLGGVAVILAIFTVFNVVNGFLAARERSAYRSQIRDLQQQARSLRNQDESSDGFDAKTAAALAERGRQANRLIVLDVFPWIRILDELEGAIPPQVVLDRFLPAQDMKTIRLTGFTPSMEPITQFQEALGRSELFQAIVLENVDIGGDASAKNRPVENGAIHFEVICGLNLKALLPEETYGGLWLMLASETAGAIRRK